MKTEISTQSFGSNGLTGIQFQMSQNKIIIEDLLKEKEKLYSLRDELVNKFEKLKSDILQSMTLEEFERAESEAIKALNQQ